MDMLHKIYTDVKELQEEVHFYESEVKVIEAFIFILARKICINECDSLGINTDVIDSIPLGNFKLNNEGSK